MSGFTKRLRSFPPAFRLYSFTVSDRNVNLISLRYVSTKTREKETGKNLLRISIVGGGATGLSAALHLAPLVDRGIIARPIHLYESKSLSDCRTHARSIGVGIWSTALEPFTKPTTHDSNQNESLTIRPTHAQVVRALENFGTYLRDVGYRTPDGSWLVKGSLNTSSISSMLDNDNTWQEKKVGSVPPSLLFIRECDFLQTLREAVSEEETKYGTIVTHYGSKNIPHTKDHASSMASSKVVAVHIPTWTEYQSLGCKDDVYRPLAGQLVFENGELSDPYHMIIAADGMNSILRQKYGGYPSSEPFERGDDRGMIDFLSSTTKQEKDDQSIAMDDRNYTVFRGNTQLTKEDGSLEDAINFQTWGDGKSMRFAAVSMSPPKDDCSMHVMDNDRLFNHSTRQETQVWFATTSDKNICNEQDPVKQKEMLLRAFSKWHDPIERLIRSTPVDNILVERGIAHKHSVNQVFNLFDILKQRNAKTSHDPALGPGPILLFTGDACMTIDPVLAQGFTVGMESAFSLASCIERCYEVDQTRGDCNGIAISTLQRELKARQSQRYERMMCVLRATDLVQSLAQPTKGLSGFISQNILRPLFKLTPSFIKEGIFMRTIQYSLGMFSSRTKR
jgi:2-polyprenyl-6-methoxyphenol hydroxylase-like FAD-dependent oxidoreductase